MFGLRRKTKPPSIDWGGLLALLEDDDRRAAVERTMPSGGHDGPVGGRESFLSALRRIAPPAAEQVLASGRQLHTAVQLIERPTVAVAGMLNSGKTSLVATFLSDAGQRRCLRGADDRQGTHRFVLWLPAAWKHDIQLWGLLLSRIGDALGRPPEMLSEDPDEAHVQYNNRGGDEQTLAVPLVATDTRLDAIGIGLLDCPDIVSDESLGLGSPEMRRRMLGKAATLCSAFLVVTSAESSRDTTLAELLRIAADLMPGIPRLLAVNKVRPQQSPDQVLEAFGPLARNHGIETIYAAYDFDVPASGPYIPDDRSNEAVPLGEPTDHAALAREGGAAGQLPVFFSLAAGSENNPPAAIDANRLLRALPSQLDRGQLFERFRLALESGLRTAVWDRGLAAIEHDAERSHRETAAAQHCLLQSAFDFFAHRAVGGEVTELRLHQSERIVRQLTESFASTAPWYARWGVRMNATLRRMFGGAGDLVRQLTPTAMARKSAGELKEKFRRGEYGGLLTPERLGKAIERHGGAGTLVHWDATRPRDLAAPAEATATAGGDAVATGEGGGDETVGDGSAGNGARLDRARLDTALLERSTQWAEAVEAAISRFERDDFTSLDPKRLDEAVRQMWKEVPVGRKLSAGLTPLVALMATFGSVLMLPLDFGGSLVLFQASIPELFTAAGLTTLSAVWAGGKNTRNVGQQAAKQQLADFHAVLCDAFGVSRPTSPLEIIVADSRETLPAPQIVCRQPTGPALAVYRVRDEFRQELSRYVPRSGPGSS